MLSCFLSNFRTLGLNKKISFYNSCCTKVSRGAESFICITELCLTDAAELKIKLIDDENHRTFCSACGMVGIEEQRPILKDQTLTLSPICRIFKAQEIYKVPLLITMFASAACLTLKPSGLLGLCLWSEKK